MFGVRNVQAVAHINKLNNVILNLFQNLWILRGYETLKQVQGDNTWFEQQPVSAWRSELN